MHQFHGTTVHQTQAGGELARQKTQVGRMLRESRLTDPADGTAVGFAGPRRTCRDSVQGITMTLNDICHLEAARRAQTICQVINIGLRVEKSLPWNRIPIQGAFDREQTNQMLRHKPPAPGFI